MKRKRVGAGLRGSSDPFQTAKDLLKSSMSDSLSDKGKESGGFYNDSSGGSGDTDMHASLAVTSSIRARAKAVAASLSSPTKAGRAMSKKQQKLAEAAKSSRNISQYFAKKQKTDKSQEEVEEVEVEEEGREGLDATLSHTTTVVPQEISSGGECSSVTVEAGEISPVESESQDVILVESKTEVIVIPDFDEEENIEREMMELEWVQDTTTEDMKSETVVEEKLPCSAR